MALDPQREIYPNAPLKLVAFELRFPPVPDFETEDGHQQMYRALRDDFPILGPPPAGELEIDLASGTRTTRPRGLRAMNRDRTCSIVMMREALTVETSSYDRYEDFAQMLKRVLASADAISPIPATQRIGLRYIDEIVVPNADEIRDWSPYIADDLLAPGIVDDYPTLDYRAGIGLAVSDLHKVAVRIGVVSEPVVDPQGPLRISDSPPGSYFLLDIDSSWDAPRDEYPEFDLDQVLEISEDLHEPVRTLFERAIKPKLRDEVFRIDPTEGA
jgi:uncharacterized protein (TIGR04255 family)